MMKDIPATMAVEFFSERMTVIVRFAVVHCISYID